MTMRSVPSTTERLSGEASMTRARTSVVVARRQLRGQSAHLELDRGDRPEHGDGGIECDRQHRGDEQEADRKGVRLRPQEAHGDQRQQQDPAVGRIEREQRAPHEAAPLGGLERIVNARHEERSIDRFLPWQSAACAEVAVDDVAGRAVDERGQSLCVPQVAIPQRADGGQHDILRQVPRDFGIVSTPAGKKRDSACEQTDELVLRGRVEPADPLR